MFAPSYALLYVESPPRSSEFYARLFGRAPVEASPGFVLFAFENGVKLGLWKKAAINPEAISGGGELCIQLGGRDEVISKHADWLASGATELASPQQMDFGYTSLIADPDGHRLRLFVPE